MVYYFNEEMVYIGQGESLDFSYPIAGYTPIKPTSENMLVGCKLISCEWVSCYPYSVDTDSKKTAYLLEKYKETVPSSITVLQGLLAIDAAGLSADYEAWANSVDRTFEEKAFINKAQIWKRDNATLLSATVTFGLTEAQLDELFITASKL